MAAQLTKWTDTLVEPPGHFVFPLLPKGVTDNDLVADAITPESYFGDDFASHDHTREELEWRADWICRVAKIVISWCVYLKHLPSENYSWTTPGPPPSLGTRGIATGVITDPKHICKILRIGTMDVDAYREKHPVDTGSGFFQWPNTRSGHWRRKAGAGATAPKTVWIDSYNVREDLMPLRGIHSGKIVNVKGGLD